MSASDISVISENTTILVELNMFFCSVINLVIVIQNLHTSHAQKFMYTGGFFQNYMSNTIL